jgi:hypothetical protein
MHQNAMRVAERGIVCVSCSPFDDSVAATMTETETETETEDDDNLKCEIVQDDEGVWSKVSNPSSATINGIQVQVRPLSRHTRAAVIGDAHGRST